MRQAVLKSLGSTIILIAVAASINMSAAEAMPQLHFTEAPAIVNQITQTSAEGEELNVVLGAYVLTPQDRPSQANDLQVFGSRDEAVAHLTKTLMDWRLAQDEATRLADQSNSDATAAYEQALVDEKAANPPKDGETFTSKLSQPEMVRADRIAQPPLYVAYWPHGEPY